MAPPPSASLPLGQRLLMLIQTLQFSWFVGHVTLIFCTVRYGIAYVTFKTWTRTARFSYRTAFVVAALTYGVVVFKAARARARAGQPGGGALGLLGDENVQYLLMAVVWLMSEQTPLALLPFTVYSVFHVATYTRTNLLPTISPPRGAASSTVPAGEKPPPPKQSALSDLIGRFVREYYDASMMLVATLEIFLWFRLLFSAILFTKGSWILLLTYTVFFRARYSQSVFVAGAIDQGVRNIDALVANQSTPGLVRQVWEMIKQLVRQAAQATDTFAYAAQDATSRPAKKAQ